MLTSSAIRIAVFALRYAHVRRFGQNGRGYQLNDHELVTIGPIL